MLQNYIKCDEQKGENKACISALAPRRSSVTNTICTIPKQNFTSAVYEGFEVQTFMQCLYSEGCNTKVFVKLILVNTVQLIS